MSEQFSPSEIATKGLLENIVFSDPYFNFNHIRGAMSLEAITQILRIVAPFYSRDITEKSYALRKKYSSEYVRSDNIQCEKDKEIIKKTLDVMRHLSLLVREILSDKIVVAPPHTIEDVKVKFTEIMYPILVENNEDPLGDVMFEWFTLPKQMEGNIRFLIKLEEIKQQYLKSQTVSEGDAFFNQIRYRVRYYISSLLSIYKKDVVTCGPILIANSHPTLVQALESYKIETKIKRDIKLLGDMIELLTGNKAPAVAKEKKERVKEYKTIPMSLDKIETGTELLLRAMGKWGDVKTILNTPSAELVMRGLTCDEPLIRTLAKMRVDLSQEVND